MRIILPAATALVLSILGVVALADDHLFTATEHGLSENGQPFQTNPAGHSGDLAPGQGSPFAGEDQQTPSTENETANDHAQIKPRG